MNRKVSRRDFLASSAVGLSALHGITAPTAPKSFAAAGGKVGPLGERKFVDVNGIRTSYFDAGSGEPFLLVHGGHWGNPGSSALRFIAIFPLLAEHFHVYAVDKVGNGFTDNPQSNDEYSLRSVVNHLYGFLQKMGMPKVHLAGSSRGGLPVLILAVEHPDLVKTLTIYPSATAAPGDVPEYVNLVPNVPEIFAQGPLPTVASLREEKLKDPRYPREYLTDEILQAEVDVAVQPKMRQAAGKVEELRSRFVEKNPELVRARPSLGNSGTGTPWHLYQMKDQTLDSIAREGRLKTPTLCLLGTEDPGVKLELGYALFELVRGSVDRAQLHVFNKCGHSPFLHYARDTAALHVNFIKNS